MNVLVTGGAGYVGSTTVEALINRGHEVVVLDHLNTGAQAARHFGSAFIQADIADSEKVAFAVIEHNVEAVIHFAFQDDLSRPSDYFKENTVKTLSLLETLSRYGVNKLVLSLTATLYDQPKALSIDEQTPIHPKDAYSESLYLVERMLPWLNQTQGLSYTSLRYADAVGGVEPSAPRRQVEAIAKAHVLALESLKDGDAKIYNLGSEGQLFKDES